MLLFAILACVHPQPPPTALPAPVVDCCDCQMWGVLGIEPGPSWQPPPRPAACTAILAAPACAAMLCPVPP